MAFVVTVKIEGLNVFLWEYLSYFITYKNNITYKNTIEQQQLIYNKY